MRPEPSSLPRHVAIIMDGNGRWAQARGLPRAAGHRAGVGSVREVVRACGELGIEVLTLYAFSTENWLRPRAEVDEIMRLLAWTLEAEVPELERRGVRLRLSGRIEGLPPRLGKALRGAQARLSGNRGLILNLALNYGARQEILDAVNGLLEEGIKAVDEKGFSERLATAGLPDPDLVIRTSGEMRLSNFLLWQLAYAEIVVTEVLWPDFGRKELLEALESYRGRVRRFGGVSPGAR